MRRNDGEILKRHWPAAALVAGGLALVVWGAAELSSHRSTNIAANRGIRATYREVKLASPPCPISGEFKSVEIQPALLCDYYEHGIEHAPPRDPSGGMQRRERYYRAPSDPFDSLLRRAISKRQDSAPRSEMQKWRIAWLSGIVTDARVQSGLESAAFGSSLHAATLLDVGRALQFLDENEIAISRACDDSGTFVLGGYHESGSVQCNEVRVRYRGAFHRGNSRMVCVRTPGTSCGQPVHADSGFFGTHILQWRGCYRMFTRRGLWQPGRMYPRYAPTGNVVL